MFILKNSRLASFQKEKWVSYITWNQEMAVDSDLKTFRAQTISFRLNKQNWEIWVALLYLRQGPRYSGADIITYPTKEILSKIAFFKKAWQTLKVLQYHWPSSS